LALRPFRRYAAGMSRASRRIEPYLSRLYGYALSLTENPQDAMDLVQECAARAIAAGRVPEDDSAYRAWLFRILRNRFIDDRRRSRHAPEALDDPDAGDDATANWQGESALISSITVKMGLKRLPQVQRDIIALVDIAGLSYAEAAALLNIPEGTVMSRLCRARRILLGYIATDNVHPFPMTKKQKSP
jgi:RNA polymerase sigma-70 factor (ECF subfamily)